MDKKVFEKTVVCDIDGTLCEDGDRRLKHLSGLADWTGYYENCHKSKPVEVTRILLEGLTEAGYKIVFVTGRPEALRRETNWFLTSIGFPMNQTELLMRDNLNDDEEAVLKEKFMVRLLRTYDVALALDCRPDVRKVYESLGIDTFGPPKDIHYPPYAMPSRIDTTEEPFIKRYGFRQRVDDFCAEKFGRHAWGNLRSTLLSYFNSREDSTYKIEEINGKPYFFSRELLTRVVNRRADVRDNRIFTPNSFRTAAVYEDEEPFSEDNRIRYFADLWSVPSGNRRFITLDGKIVESDIDADAELKKNIAAFYASPTEKIQRSDKNFDYALLVDKKFTESKFHKLSQKTKDCLERIKALEENGSFRFTEFAEGFKDDNSEKFQKYGKKNGENWIQLLEREAFVKPLAIHNWKAFPIQVTNRFKTYWKEEQEKKNEPR